ncbi:MAG: hypothetical protein B5M48_02380 [Candidatus Omnitrophica bacterium 4484_213]|nr:MAG: hypothetical protein B5M48_02380 [Candidatus Omnitrophica bacterium 4484_213]
MTITFKTIGCKVNQYETQLLREQFASIGWQEVEEGGDVYLINTCSVTAAADRKSRYLINSALKLNPQPKVIVIGCGVNNRFSGIRDIKGVVFNVRSFASDKPQTISYFKNHTRAFIKIQDGCDNFCSFCIIPYLRGRSRSRDVEQIITEVKQLADNRFKEIILSGVNLGAYGKDIGMNLIDLIEELEKIKGIERIRLSSLNPEDVTQDLIAKFRDSQKLCPHLHISLQSGDDAVLKRMNRPYTSSDFLNLIERIRKIDPLFSFTTDILIGFPGEGEREFLNTLKLVKKVEFTRTHIFSYSPREGTKAASFPQMVCSAEIKRRLNLLKEITAESSYNYRRRFLNQDAGPVRNRTPKVSVGHRRQSFFSSVKVLVEDKKDKNGYLKGYTERYVKVLLKGSNKLKNKIISVKINKVDVERTFGVVERSER